MGSVQAADLAIVSAPGTPLPMDTAVPSEPINDLLLTEIRQFRADCEHRYKFNNRWDITLSILGFLLSVAVVVAGFLKNPQFSAAVLGAVIAAVLTAQKAFPFGQRAMFYRLLVGQVVNLQTRVGQGLLGKKDAVDLLSTLRMDFAQQLPRGSSAQERDAAPRSSLSTEA